MKLFPFDQNVKLEFLYFFLKVKGAAKVIRKRYKKQILDKISNLSPEESKMQGIQNLSKEI
jgi:hypothetical protein